MAEAKIPIRDTDDYIIEHGRDSWYQHEMVKGTDAVDVLAKLHEDRDTWDVNLYHVVGKVDHADDEDGRFCIVYDHECNRGKHVVFQIMVADFVETFMKRWKSEPGASNVRLYKIEEIGRFHNNWFFRDFAKMAIDGRIDAGGVGK